MYCQRCGSEMGGCKTCPVCGNEQKVSWADKMGGESKIMKCMRNAAEAGVSIVKGVLKGVIETSIQSAVYGMQNTVNKETDKAVHDMLVKMKLEKKTLGERMQDVKRKKRKW